MSSPYYNANIQLPPVGAQVPDVDEPDEYKKKQQKGTSVVSKHSIAYDEEPPRAAIPGVGGLSKMVEDYNREGQPRRCRDVFWAILFIVHLVFMAYLTATYVPIMTKVMSEDYAGHGGSFYNNDDDGNNSGRRRLTLRLRFLEDDSATNYDDEWAKYVEEYYKQPAEDSHGWTYNHYNKNGNAYREEVQLDLGLTLTLVVFNGITGLVGSTLALGFMMAHAEAMIRGGMIASVFLSLFLGLFCLTARQVPGALAGLVMSGLLIWYAYHVWSRIPFAAANLVTATTAVRVNLGVTVYAYLTLALAFGWAVFWTASAVSTMFVVSECEGDGTCNKDFNGWMIFGFFVSYFWTVQVFNNVVGVTVAGVTGTWWMAPLNAASFCSEAVQDSFQRAVTYSFGSICFGSLVVAVMSAARRTIHQLRDSDNGLLICIGECILHCIENALDYFNEWAFTFVGIYGFSYMEAGIQVVDLFRSRGWETIITDDLTDRALLIVSFVIALLNGLVGLVIGSAMNLGHGVPLLIPFL